MLLLSQNLPGSGIRAEVLHPGQEIPYPTIVLILKFEAAKANPFLTTSNLLWSKPWEMISAFNKNPKLILPGSGIRAEVLHPRQETPSPLNQLKFFSKILSCRVWTIHNFQNGENPKVGFWRAVLKMELWIWPFLCSIFLSLSIFFYPLKYPINFQTEKAPAFPL